MKSGPPLSSPTPKLLTSAWGNSSSSAEDLPCQVQRVCTQWEQLSPGRKLDPAWMTVVMGKQYVYSQCQSMFCTLWWAFPQQKIGGRLRNPTWLPCSHNQFDYCSCFLLPVYTPQFKHLIRRPVFSGFKSTSFLWHAQQGGWRVVLACSGLQSALRFPRNTFFSSMYILPLSSVALSSSFPFFSLGQLHTLPQASSSPMSREPRPSPYHASKCLLLLALGQLRAPWLGNNMSYRSQYMNHRPPSKMF